MTEIMELTDVCSKRPIPNIFKDMEDGHNEERNGKYNKELSEISRGYE